MDTNSISGVSIRTAGLAPRVGQKTAIRRLLLPTLFLWHAIALSAAGTCEPVAAGFRDFSYGPTGNSTPTGEKAESKLWWTDGSWWGSLYHDPSQSYHIYRFDTLSNCWQDTETALDDRNNSKADVLWVEADQKLYVVSHVFTTMGQPTPSSSQWGRLYRYTYGASTKTYTLDSGFPVHVTRGDCETLVLAKDSHGRLWVTYVEGAKVMVNHSRSSDLDWGEPFVLPVDPTAVSVSSDDISAVIAFQGDKIGVLWSNQLTAQMFFTAHLDGDAPTVWQPLEVILPGPACSGACADDMINLAADSQGRVFAALKTSLTGPDDPLNLLAVRTPNGSWSSSVFGRVKDHHTRAIVAFDEEHERIYMFATAPESGGSIYYKTTPVSNIQFPLGQGNPFIQSETDTRINNVTSTKQNVSSQSGLVAEASDQTTRFYFHNSLNLKAGSEPEITSFTPTTGTPGSLVTIEGKHFSGTTAVAFGGASAPVFVVLSETIIMATVPLGATTGKISVTNSVGTGTSAGDFTVIDLLSAVTPPSFDLNRSCASDVANVLPFCRPIPPGPQQGTHRDAWAGVELGGTS